MNWDRFALYNYTAGEGGRSGIGMAARSIGTFLIVLFLLGEFFRLL